MTVTISLTGARYRCWIFSNEAPNAEPSARSLRFSRRPGPGAQDHAPPCLAGSGWCPVVVGCRSGMGCSGPHPDPGIWARAPDDRIGCNSNSSSTLQSQLDQGQHVVSPVAGVVSSRLVSEQDLVTIQQPLITIQQHNRVSQILSSQLTTNALNLFDDEWHPAHRNT